MKRLCHPSIVVLSVLVGCADTDSSTDMAPPSESPDTWEDEQGMQWLRSGAAVFDTRADEETELATSDKSTDGTAVEDAQSEPDPEQLTDEAWGKMMEPITEFNGSEYRLSTASLRAYGAKLRSNAIRRKNEVSTEGQGGSLSLSGSDLLGETPLASANDLQTKAIIGTDNRVVANWARAIYPAADIAYMVGSTGVCTGFKVINHHTMGTAAHCMHTGSAWKPRKDATFSDGRFGTVPAGCYSRTVPGEWVNHPNLPKNDYAVIALRKTSAGTWCDLSTYDVGYLGWQAVGYNSTISGDVIGYPGQGSQPPGSPGYPTLATHYTGGAQVGTFQPQVLQYYNDATGGQSGAPFISVVSTGNYRVRAIHKGEADRIVMADYNQGREFEGNTADFMTANGGS